MTRGAMIFCGVVVAALFLCVEAEIGADVEERLSLGRSLLNDDFWKKFDKANEDSKKGSETPPPPTLKCPDQTINAAGVGGDGGKAGDGGDNGGGGGGGNAAGGAGVNIANSVVCANNVAAVDGKGHANADQNINVVTVADGGRRLRFHH